MKRVLILVEGITEANFTQDVLAPHLLSKGIFLQKPSVIVTKIVVGKPYFKGGVSKYNVIKEQLFNLLKDTNVSAVTTMFDYYAFPKDFIGWQTIPAGDVYQKITHLEKIFGDDFQSSRFIPFLMLHEFENLLFSHVEEISTEFAPDKKSRELEQIRAKFPSPEEINDNPNTTASKRLVSLFPDYQKDVNGRNIARRIGLAKIREACQHFDTWVRKLEQLAQAE